MSRLTNKQEAFAQHYALNGSPIEAYRAAGYSKAMSANSTAVEAQKLLKKPKIAGRIAELSARVRRVAEDKFDISAERVLRQFEAIAFADAGDFVEWKDGAVTAKASDDPDTAATPAHHQGQAGARQLRWRGNRAGRPHEGA